MTVGDLMDILRSVPADLPVMLRAESNVDFAGVARVAAVVGDARDWSGTPVGQYLIVDELPLREPPPIGEAKGWDAYAPRPAGEAFRALIVDFDPR